MPIGGFVITVDPQETDTLRTELDGRKECEVHGTDAKGNIVAVIETETGDAMDEIVLALEKDPRILSVGLAYLHAEDEIDKIISGEVTPDLRKHRKNESS